MTSSREVSWKISIKVLKLKTSGQIARAKFSYISQIEFIVVLLPVDFIVFKTGGNLYRLLGCFNWPNRTTGKQHRQLTQSSRTREVQINNYRTN